MVGRAYVVGMAALVLLYYTVAPLRPVTAGAVGLAATATIVTGVVCRRPRRAGGWLLLAVATALLGTGNVLLTLKTSFPAGGFPTAADICYLLAYLPLAIGLIWLGRPRFVSRDWPMLLDIGALSLAGSAVVWIVLVRPAVLGMHMTGFGRIAAVISGVGFVAVLAAAVRVMLAWYTSLTFGLLSLGTAGFLVADFSYAFALIHGTWTAGPVNLGYLAFGALAGAAALRPDVSEVRSADPGRHQLGPGRLVLLAVTLLIGPSALLIEATSGPVTTGVAIGLVTAAVAVLMLVRLALSAQALRRRLVRESAFRAASRSLMVATTAGEVQAGLDTAMSTMVDGHHDRARARLVGPVPGPPGAGTVDKGATTTVPAPAEDLSPAQLRTTGSGRAVPGADGALVVPLAGADPGQRTAVFTGPPGDLVELAAMLTTLADQAGLALARIDLSWRLRAEERERYFRSLVLTSRDVTLICRNGRIDYATPSAGALFRYDVRGRLFDSVVRRSAAADTLIAGHPAGDRSVTIGPAAEPEPWSSFEDGTEGVIEQPGGVTLTVEVHRRDLTDDPTVAGVVTTLRDVTAERELQRTLSYRATHDGLTGLANAELFRDQLRGDREASTPGAIGAVAFIDLDDFKLVNDVHGHDIGDGLLMTVAHRIRSTLRTGDLASRLGGDEFAVLLRDVPNFDAARRAAQRIADVLARPAIVGGLSVDCRASIGLAIASGPDEYDSLLRHADTALYSAKAEGKGRWRQYRHGMLSTGRRRTDLRAELELAIEHEALTLHYQPIIELATGVTVGYEALIRTRRPELSTADSMMSATPANLVRLAEDHGLIVQLGDWVLTRALADTGRLNTDPAVPIFMAVNVSATQLRIPGFADTVRQRLATSGVDPGLLVFEITENLLVEEDERAWSYLGDLRADGVRVAIDDYGTGYASLSYLRQPGIDIVKIDGSFVREITSTRNRTLLDAVVGLTARLGLDQIAEGIEDSATRDVLIELGCRYGQGFLYAQPMPIDAAVRWRPPALALSRG
jgi:diguanylate cyclase (GGDEF)-like protein